MPIVANRLGIHVSAALAPADVTVDVGGTVTVG